MPNSLIDLSGKYALVTGGSRGIGRAICIRLAEHGARVCFNYLRNRDAAAEAMKAISKVGPEPLEVRWKSTAGRSPARWVTAGRFRSATTFWSIPPVRWRRLLN